ncbi:MAG TPA: hypothetical protein VND80_03005 [Steroidobacteraceae bacterium]|nr:hypothetical protein [Steroidobacteraceae bacterium]
MTVTPRALLISAAVAFAAVAANPAPQPQPQAQQSPPQPPPPAQWRPAGTDEGLIEFLGDDDIPDQKWWQFMKRKAPIAPAQQSVRQDSKP